MKVNFVSFFLLCTEMWTDPSFDVANSCVGITKLQANERIISYPISRLYKNCTLFASEKPDSPDISAEDVMQGSLGDCWLLSALSTIAQKDPESIRRCILVNNEKHGYSLIQLGSYRTFVDHYIPLVINDQYRLIQIIAPRLSKSGEYWTFLIEKAFIKFFASYLCPPEIRSINVRKRLQNGISVFGHSYIDVHGGFPRWVISSIYSAQVEVLRTFKQPQSWADLLADTENEIVVACACTSSEHTDSVKGDGFVYAHAYSILYTSPGKIRVRNPWGVYENTELDDGVDDGAFTVTERTFREKFPLVCYLRIKKK